MMPFEFARHYILTWLLAATLAGLAGCADFSKCGFAGCPGDAEITAAVQGIFAQHADLEPPNLINVKTIDRVVYLSGIVSTDLQRQTAQSLAQQAPGVRRVVNSIGISYSGH
jgi:osmotically-inducible protein OsmY